MHELVLSGGMVYDGLGSAGRTADVAVSAGRVTAVGRDLGAAARVIDVSGLAVAPGFLDPHSHSDLVPLRNGPHPFKLRQGVTTEINGNCGFSPAPNSGPEPLADLFHGPVATWTFAEYLDALAAAGPVNHMAVLVGHSTLRVEVARYARTLPPGGLERMCELADDAFRAGAIGLSSGLIYPPGAYGDTDELVALAEVAHRYGRPYTTHMRDEGDELEAALDEAVEIARRARVRLQVSHCKAGGTANHGKSRMLLDRLRRARAEGVDVRGDQYPYLAGSTSLSALLPPEALEGGRLRERLADPAERARLRAVAEDTTRSIGIGFWRHLPPGAILIGEHRTAAGRTLSDLANGRDAWETACDLIAEDPAASMIITMMADEDVLAIMADPLIGIGSDNGPPVPGEHPRTWGCFPRFLGEYVRGRKVVSLAEAVRKMTSATADQFGLTGRGHLLPGAVADVTVFDPETIGHAGTYERPDVDPTGVEYVLLEGHVVLDGGEFTGDRRGRVLRAGR